MALAWQWTQIVLLCLGIGLLCGLPFVVLGCLAGMWEKRMVWPYIACEEHEAPTPTPYARQMNRMAEEQGFTHLACTRDGKGALYQVRYDLWLSPDRDVLAIVGSGTMARIPFRNTWLFSKLIDGRALITVDSAAGMSHDPTGLYSDALLLNADFPELLARQRARTSAEMTPVEPYSEEDPLADHLALRASQADQFVATGLATYLDDERMVWRLTPAGAINQALRTYLKSWGATLPNLGRRRVHRPGQLGYVASDRGPTRKVLRYAEIACWLTFLFDVFFLMPQPIQTREQLFFRLGLGAAAMVGMVGTRLTRWWVSWRQGGVAGPSMSRMTRRIAFYAVCLAIGIGVARWQAERRRAERAAAMAQIMAMMPKTVEADVSLDDLERETKGVAHFEYIGSDPEKHHFLDESRPKLLRFFQVDRKAWTPPRTLEPDPDESIPVAFRDGKLVCLKAEEAGPTARAEPVD